MPQALAGRACNLIISLADFDLSRQLQQVNSEDDLFALALVIAAIEKDCAGRTEGRIIQPLQVDIDRRQVSSGLCERIYMCQIGA